MIATPQRWSERRGRVRVRALLGRALRLRCPACGGDALYARSFVMRERCAHCGLAYEPEQGFFLGAMYVNYAVTVSVGLGTVLFVDWLHPMSLTSQLSIAIPLMALVPVLFFHHARSLWLALNLLVVGREP